MAGNQFNSRRSSRSPGWPAESRSWPWLQRGDAHGGHHGTDSLLSATVCESPTWQSVSLQPVDMWALLQMIVFCAR